MANNTTITEEATQVGTTLQELILQPLRAFWAVAVEQLPSIATALFVLVIMCLGARLARGILGKILRLSRLDGMVASTRLGTVLEAFRTGLTASDAITYMVYAALVLTAWATAADLVGLTPVKATLISVLAYVPKLLSALLILALGGWLASVARRAIAAVLSEVQSPYAHALEGITELVILIMAATVGLGALGIQMNFISSNLTIVVAAGTVTIGLLFVWAMRRPAEQIISNYYLRRLIHIGDTITIGEQTGEVVKFVSLGIILQNNDNQEHFIPAHCVLGGIQRSGKAAPSVEPRDV